MDAGGIKNILIIKLSSIGDCLLATPAIESIRKGYPDSFITWLIEDKSKDIALLNPNVDEVIVIDKKKFKISDYLSLIKKLKSRHYDLSIDLQGVDRTSIFAFLSGAKIRCVEEYANLGFLNNKKIIRGGRPPEHAAQFYLFLAEKCGGKKIPDINFALITSDEDKKFAGGFLKKNFDGNIDNNLFVGINPAGAWKTKRWPIKYFIELSKRLILAFHVNIVIFGGKGDECFAQEILKEVESDKIKSAVSKTSLKQAKELLMKMDYFITPDSSLMHIASSIEGLKTIALFGPTDPKLTGPLGKNSVVLRDNLYCMPCFKKECPLNKTENKNLKECVLCMRRITPDKVFSEISKDTSEKGLLNG
ncbi:MAG: glycosyltransferase family 9 protein [Deltaproteobacteria bacterium]|nr:glycosyltransferase family 9 protein [Deltaproteobacteria bacterium]